MTDNKDLHSTGRGGLGNIGAGEGSYADAAFYDGTPGRPTVDQDHLTAFSGGRGGAGNTVVHDSKTGAAVGSGSVPAPVGEYVGKPAGETAAAAYPDYHTGRGGEGNVHKDKFGGHSKPAPTKERVGEENGAHEHPHLGIKEKVMHAVGLDKEKK